MYRVWDFRLAPNFGVRPGAVKNFYFRSTIEKMGAFPVLPRNICGQMVEVAANFQLRLTAQIQKLKYKVKS